MLILVGWGRRRKLEDAEALELPSVEEVEVVDDFSAEAAEKSSTVELQATAQMPEAKATAGGARAASPSRKARPGASKPGASRASRSKRVAIVPGRDRYHEATCRFAKNPSARQVTVATARRRGLQPCSVCKPG